MADLLGATNPVPGYDNTNVNRNIPISPNNNQVQNVPDLDRVTGADHRTEQQDAGQAGEKIRYDSNYQTFIQQLRQGQDGVKVLAKLLAREGTVVTSGMIDPSATRSPSMPRTRSWASTTASRSRPMRQVPTSW